MLTFFRLLKRTVYGTSFQCLVAVAGSLLILYVPSAASALESYEILVIANQNSKKSIKLAKYYMKQRSIPKNNLFKIDIAVTESCSRSEYQKKIVLPLRNYFNDSSNRALISCLVLMYDLPLKISSSPGEKDTTASVDSELALILKKDYPLKGWVPNPYYLKIKYWLLKKDKILMISRLDGPTEKIVKRIIDDSIFAEKNGLKGTAYFDARWHDKNIDSKSAYEKYDFYIHLAARLIKRTGLLPVVKDDKEKLFQSGNCPKAALYCGWYSLANYVDAFEWVPGSIGFHIASSECVTLKKKDSRIWCKMMLEKGISATLGPVGEPYINAFPNPAQFFRLLTSGEFCLVESYMISLPYLSWKMVLIGDPMYRPGFGAIRP